MIVPPDALHWPIYGRKSYSWIMEEFDGAAPGTGAYAPYTGVGEGPYSFPAEQDALIDKWTLTYAVVESNGMQLAIVQQMQDLAMAVIGQNVDSSKRARAWHSMPFWEQGRIILPVNHPTLAKFEDQVLDFPKGEHDDLVDMMTLAVAHAAETGGRDPMPPEKQEKYSQYPEELRQGQQRSERAYRSRPNWREGFEGLMPR